MWKEAEIQQKRLLRDGALLSYLRWPYGRTCCKRCGKKCFGSLTGDGLIDDVGKRSHVQLTDEAAREMTLWHSIPGLSAPSGELVLEL